MPEMNASRGQRRRAVTLIELVVSLGIVTTLVGGMASALVLASRAAPSSDTPTGARLEASRVAEQLAGDLYVAESVTARSATGITFTVADRGHDPAGVESIRYAWSGTPGASLFREYNGGTPQEVLTDVYEFDLAYDLIDTGQGGGATPQENPSVWIVSVPLDPSYTENEFVVSTSTWCGQYFYPDPALLPSDTVSWKLETVYFRLKKVGSPGGITAAQVQQANVSGLPTGVVYDELQIDESNLSGQSWSMITLVSTNAPTLGVGEGLCLVLKPVSGTNTCVALHQTPAAATANATFLASSDGGGSWTPAATGVMANFTVYATVTTQSGGQAGGVYAVAGVNISMSKSQSSSGRVETGVQLLNAPEVTGP